MATTRVELKPFIISIVVVGFLEAIVGTLATQSSAASLFLLGTARIFEAVIILLVFKRQTNGLAALGLSLKTLWRGLVQGLVWSATFGTAVLVGFAILSSIGIDPFTWIGVRMPVNRLYRIYFFLVGALISPMAEEMFFRGVIFGYFRRWGFWPALIVSTVLFMVAHFFSTQIPVTQLVGGVVFAVAYEKTKSLITPMMIHILGNLALFSLSSVSLLNLG